MSDDDPCSTCRHYAQATHGVGAVGSCVAMAFRVYVCPTHCDEWEETPWYESSTVIPWDSEADQLEIEANQSMVNALLAFRKDR